MQLNMQWLASSHAPTVRLSKIVWEKRKTINASNSLLYLLLFQPTNKKKLIYVFNEVKTKPERSLIILKTAFLAICTCAFHCFMGRIEGLWTILEATSRNCKRIEAH